ncbi:MAG: SDR family NAD(P)-dependent oxidoreductase [Deltaproteobacteria bacterium]|nr:SDR family NAD(P)-dependent oxidoreductase [Deltaproteobacteria bacterium]
MTTEAKRVLVTGATGGVGRAVVDALVAEGCEVFASGRNVEALLALSRGRSDIHGIELDVTSEPSIEAARREILEATNGEGVDAIVHAAGIAELGPLLTVTEAALRRHFEVNVVGFLAVTRALLEPMKARGRGRVIVVASVLDRVTLATHGAYGSSMHALRGLCEAWRMELALFGIDVTLVEPGSVRQTGFIRDAFGGLDAKRSTGSRWNGVIDRLQSLERAVSGFGAPPERVAQSVVRALRSRRAPRRAVTPSIGSAGQLVAKRLLPTRTFDNAVRSVLGLRPRRTAPLTSTVLQERPVAVVTGAAGGIGAATVRRLARAGYRVVATDRDADALERLHVALVAEQLSVATEVLDVTSRRDVVHVARKVHEDFGDVDLLVNNAGYAELGPVDVVDLDALRRQLDVNVLGPMRMVRAFAPQMCDRGAGRIVQVSSVAGLVAFPFMGVYHASKFALEALSDALRQELGSFGVDVVLVEPAFIRTGFAAAARRTVEPYRESDAGEAWRPAFDRMERLIGRLDAVGGEAEDVAEAIFTAARAAEPQPRYATPWTAEVAARALPWVPAALRDTLIGELFDLRAIRREL